MNTEYREMLTEIDVILENMSDSEVNKIPIKLREFIRNNKSTEYSFTIDNNIPFSEQKLKKDTIDFLALLSEAYFIEGAEKKLKFRQILVENEKKHEQELRDKYNPDKIFENSNKNNVRGKVKWER